MLITVDEETGLTGADDLRPGRLKAKYLLNLDSEEEGFLTIGCAGGVDSVATRKLTCRPRPRAPRLPAQGVRPQGRPLRHRHQRRPGNAIRLLAQALAAWAGFDLALAAVKGGNKRNAIPREASALMFLDPAEAGFQRCPGRA